MKVLIADLMLLSMADGPVFAASSPFHREPWPIYNGSITSHDSRIYRRLCYATKAT